MTKTKPKIVSEACEFTAGFVLGVFKSTQDEEHTQGIAKSVFRAYLSASKAFSKEEIDAKVNSLRITQTEHEEAER